MSKLRNAALVGSVVCSLAVGMITGWEGKSNKAYLDLVQVPTICYGHTKNVKLGDIKTDNECTLLLRQEITRIDNMITSVVKVQLSDHERAALISFTYNVGDSAFKRSYALQRINRGDVKGGCEALATRDYSTGVCRGYGCGWAGGKMVKGLQNRRSDERLMCLGEKT